MTRSDAVAFVTAVMDCAHEMGVPVGLISHKPWWLPLANSRLTVARGPKRLDEEGCGAFHIDLAAEILS